MSKRYGYLLVTENEMELLETSSISFPLARR
jgi:hypothetical protein